MRTAGILASSAALLVIGTDPALARSTGPEPAQLETPSHALDGQVVQGQVRARGLIGLFSVRGVLSFEDGQLIWTVDGQSDGGPYGTRDMADGTAFTAEHILERGERAIWTGHFDGSRFHDVTIRWVRVEGDAIHDLLLPDEVMLDFTPVDGGRSDVEAG